MDYFNPIKNKYNYEQNQKTNSSRHKRSISSIQSSGNSNREINQSSNRKAKNIIHSFHSNNNNYQRNAMFNKEKDNIEDYQRLAKKFYSIIITLQDELTKQTIKNYSLLEENLNLKQQFSEIQKKMNPSN
jgi:hypothetical protein